MCEWIGSSSLQGKDSGTGKRRSGAFFDNLCEHSYKALCNKDTQRNKWSTSRKGGEWQGGGDKEFPLAEGSA
jgi:hypothetical protein